MSARKPAEVKVSRIFVHERHGEWYAFGTVRGFVEVRVTPTGILRPGPFMRGWHPVFCPPKTGPA